MEEDDGGTAGVESRELLDEELQEDRREQSPVQQQLHVHPELRKEQQRNRSALMLRDNRDGRVRKSNNPYDYVLESFRTSTFAWNGESHFA